MTEGRFSFRKIHKLEYGTRIKFINRRKLLGGRYSVVAKCAYGQYEGRGQDETAATSSALRAARNAHFKLLAELKSFLNDEGCTVHVPLMHLVDRIDQRITV